MNQKITDAIEISSKEVNYRALNIGFRVIILLLSKGNAIISNAAIEKRLIRLSKEVDKLTKDFENEMRRIKNEVERIEQKRKLSNAEIKKYTARIVIIFKNAEYKADKLEKELAQIEASI